MTGGEGGSLIKGPSFNPCNHEFTCRVLTPAALLERDPGFMVPCPQKSWVLSLLQMRGGRFYYGRPMRKTDKEVAHAKLTITHCVLAILVNQKFHCPSILTAFSYLRWIFILLECCCPQISQEPSIAELLEHHSIVPFLVVTAIPDVNISSRGEQMNAGEVM